MKPDVSLAVVGYRSGAVLPEAVSTFRREAAALALPAEVVVVDHSEDPGEAERARAVRPDTLLVLPNRGYAAGINAAIGASHGRVVVFGNPDVSFDPGSLAQLLAAAGNSRDVVAPQPERAGFLDPPADPQDPVEEARRWLASTSPLLWRRFLCRQARRWLAVWRAGKPVEVPMLSGALLAAPRVLLDELGPWDENYFLFYEESDWLLRARRRGVRLVVAPAARLHHLRCHAAGAAHVAAHWRTSRRRYFVKNYGLAGRVVLPLEIRRSPLHPATALPARVGAPDDDVLWLISPTSLGFPAAGLHAGPEPPVTALREVLATTPPAESHVVVALSLPRLSLLGAWRVQRTL